MLEIKQSVWVINNNRIENLMVVGYEIVRMLYGFSDSIEKNDNYVYLANENEIKKDTSNSEVKIKKESIRFKREDVFLTKEDLIKSL